MSLSIIRTTVIGLALLASARAHADIDTQTVLKGAIADKHTTGLILIAMVDGLITYQAYSKDKIFCVPNMEFSGDSYVSLFSNYANDHAELLGEPAAITMFFALKNSFPCKPN